MEKRRLIFYLAGSRPGWSTSEFQGKLQNYRETLFQDEKQNKTGQWVAHAFNPSTWEAEAGESLLVRDLPGLQELVPGQAPKQHRETLSQKTKKKKKKKKEKQSKTKDAN